MTHAKLWLAQGRMARLAVGSWNCTEPGSSSFELRNVEAGILLDVAPATQIAGQPLTLGAKDFGTDEMLQDDELNPAPYPLPFELLVSFDWAQGCYEVQGRLYERNEGTGYPRQVRAVSAARRCQVAEPEARHASVAPATGDPRQRRVHAAVAEGLWVWTLSAGAR